MTANSAYGTPKGVSSSYGRNYGVPRKTSIDIYRCGCSACKIPAEYHNPSVNKNDNDIQQIVTHFQLLLTCKRVSGKSQSIHSYVHGDVFHLLFLRESG